MTILERLALLPVVPVSGRGRARFEPIWAEDVAAAVDGPRSTAPPRPRAARFELSGPETMTHEAIVATALRAQGHQRRLMHVPAPLVRQAPAPGRDGHEVQGRPRPGTRPSCWRSR